MGEKVILSPRYFFVDNMTEKNYITIVGLGNILFQDEWLGVHFVRWFENNQHVPEEELPNVFFLHRSLKIQRYGSRIDAPCEKKFPKWRGFC